MAASISCGFGAASSPPCSGGSSTVNLCVADSIRWCLSLLPTRRALAFNCVPSKSFGSGSSA